jgi:acid phosphatase family membrane protein YuiD
VLQRHTRMEVAVGTVVGVVAGALFHAGLRFIRG